MVGTLKAKVSGNWVPILGSGFDAANTMRWNAGWGVIATTQITANQTGIAGSAVAVTGGSLTVTTVAGRRYLVTFAWLGYGDGTNCAMSVTLTRDGTQLT